MPPIAPPQTRFQVPPPAVVRPARVAVPAIKLSSAPAAAGTARQNNADIEANQTGSTAPAIASPLVAGARNVIVASLKNNPGWYSLGSMATSITGLGLVIGGAFNLNNWGHSAAVGEVASGAVLLAASLVVCGFACARMHELAPPPAPRTRQARGGGGYSNYTYDAAYENSLSYIGAQTAYNVQANDYNMAVWTQNNSVWASNN